MYMGVYVCIFEYMCVTRAADYGRGVKNAADWLGEVLYVLQIRRPEV